MDMESILLVIGLILGMIGSFGVGCIMGSSIAKRLNVEAKK